MGVSGDSVEPSALLRSSLGGPFAGAGVAPGVAGVPSSLPPRRTSATPGIAASLGACRGGQNGHFDIRQGPSRAMQAVRTCRQRQAAIKVCLTLLTRLSCETLPCSIFVGGEAHHMRPAAMACMASWVHVFAGACMQILWPFLRRVDWLACPMGVWLDTHMSQPRSEV